MERERSLRRQAIRQSDGDCGPAVLRGPADAARAANALADTRRGSAAGPPALDGAAAVITFIGHATFLIQTAAGNLLTDPMYSERASPLT